MAASLFQSFQNAVVVALVGLPDPLVSLLAGSRAVRDGQVLDAQLQLLLRLMAAAGLPRVETLAPAEARAFFRESAGLLGGAPIDVARVLDESAPREGGGAVPLRVVVPASGRAPHPVLVYYHGGGWTVGDLDTHDGVARRLAASSHCIVVSVDYRLGPEHRFPAAADDAVAAFAWVADNAARFGGDASRLAVGGDSAGGNLAAVVCQQALASAGRVPDFQLLVYPVTDLAEEAESYQTFAEGFYLTRPLMRWFRDNYLARREDGVDPRASPLRAASLAGLPPAYVATAGYDPLRDEGGAYARRLAEAGVAVEYRNHESLIHGYFSMAGVVRGAARAFDEAADALRRGLKVDA
jgi:acetyl esterase